MLKEKLQIAILYGSVRNARQGIKVARFMKNKVEERGHKVTLIDPCELKIPLLEKTYDKYEEGTAPGDLDKVAEILKNADAYIAVTAEYNHTPPPALINLIDYFFTEYFFKPSSIVSYSDGPFGGVRAAVQLRSLLAEVGMSSVPTMFPVSKVQDAFDDRGNAIDDSYNHRIKKPLDELEWYAHALKEAREKGLPY